MFFKILLRYLSGYVTIHVEGYFVERFINICKSKNMFLWNMKRRNTSTLAANIGIKDFKKIKQIAKKTKCRIGIEGKKGIPFFLHRYKKRKIFFFFLLFMVTLVTLTSNFIWNIEIKGNSTIATEDLLKNLTENGLSVGKYKGKIDTKTVINNIRLNRDDIAWLGIHLKGTNAIIEVVEADKKPDIIDENEYCSTISEKEGVISKIDAANGTPLVKIGDVVRPGTVLIGGWIEGKYTGIRYVHSQGEVKAKVWYNARERIDLKQTVKQRTGKEEKKYSISINNFKINLYKRLSKFKNYDTIDTSKKIKIFSDFYIPVGLTECHNFETEEKQVEYSVEEAKQMAAKKAEEEALKQISNTENIQDKTINFYENEGYVEAEVILEVLETIGTKEKIVF